LRAATNRVLKRRGSPGETHRYLIGAAGLLALVTLLLVTNHSSSVPQPVAFNHRRHTQDLGLGCDFCHRYVRSSAHAGLPDAQTCSICHSARQGTSEEAARVTELISAGDRLRFRKLFRLPAHVYYTHRRHVAIAGLECQKCHGAIAETERPPARPLVEVTMDFCLNCHRESEATLNCNACHR
jgi:predicted CXXCH cytochrome family protein